MSDDRRVDEIEPEEWAPLASEELARPTIRPARPWTIGLLVGGVLGLLIGVVAWGTSLAEILLPSGVLAVFFAPVVPGLGFSFLVSGLVLAFRPRQIIRRIERIYVWCATGVLVVSLVTQAVCQMVSEANADIDLFGVFLVVVFPAWLVVVFCALALTVCLAEFGWRMRDEARAESRGTASSTAP
jgi:hypothetical protein